MDWFWYDASGDKSGDELGNLRHVIVRAKKQVSFRTRMHQQVPEADEKGKVLEGLHTLGGDGAAQSKYDQTPP
jgi:hypothetical protein